MDGKTDHKIKGADLFLWLLLVSLMQNPIKIAWTCPHFPDFGCLVVEHVLFFGEDTRVVLSSWLDLSNRLEAI